MQAGSAHVQLTAPPAWRAGTLPPQLWTPGTVGHAGHELPVCHPALQQGGWRRGAKLLEPGRTRQGSTGRSARAPTSSRPRTRAAAVVAAAARCLGDERQGEGLVQAAQLGGAGGGGGVAEHAAALHAALVLVCSSRSAITTPCGCRQARLAACLHPSVALLPSSSLSLRRRLQQPPSPHPTPSTHPPLPVCGAGLAPGHQSSAACSAPPSSPAPAAGRPHCLRWHAGWRWQSISWTLGCEHQPCRLPWRPGMRQGRQVAAPHSQPATIAAARGWPRLRSPACTRSR